MSPAVQNRQPEGIPVGGQYAPTAHSEPAVKLSYAANLQSFADEVAGRPAYDAAVKRAQSAAAAYANVDEDGEIEMDDAEFDRILSEIRTYEKRFGITPEHSLHTVGQGGGGGGDVEHDTRMLSLEKPGEEAVIEFARKHPNAIVEPKIDGLAISVKYEDGKMIRAAKRGDGYTGEDVTDRVRGVEGLPEVAGEGDYEVRGELYLNDENKAKANEIRAAAGKPPFKNARNGVAGMLSKQDGTYAGLFSFAAYSTTLGQDKDHLENMEDLTGMGFTTARSLLPQSVLDAEDPMAAVAALGAERKGLDFLMDGAVLKVNGAAERAALGEGSSAPKWAVAYKYPAVEEPTVIEDIEYNIGKTGRLSIRARLTPVEVDGSVVEYASLHNVGHLQAADLRIGDTVSAFRANDVIPQVHLPRADLRSADSQPWAPPAVCPQCSEPFDKSTELWRCHTPECSVSGRIAYAVSRDAGLDIEGFGTSIGDALIEADLVKDVGDVFSLTEDQLAGLDMGETSTGGTRTLGQKNAAKIMAEIEKAKAQPLNRIITALSMRFTGRTFGRRLAAQFETMEALQAATVSQLANVEGIGEKKAEVIHEQLKKNAPVIAKLRAAGVNMGAPKPKPAAGAAGPKLAKEGKPLSVVVTGSVKAEPTLASLSRTGVQELIETNGGKASGSVSKSTDILVSGEEGSTKWNAAQKLRQEQIAAGNPDPIKILTPQQFAEGLRTGNFDFE
jgi:DNA ligase (NAD+)